MTETIRRARPGDEAELTALIHELAAFERAAEHCTVTEEQMRTALFGSAPTVHAHVAEVDGEIAAGALWFLNFSTWDKYSDDPETVIRKLKNIDKFSHNGTMPLWYYLLEHADARLSEADREVLARWVSDAIAAEQKREQ